MQEKVIKLLISIAHISEKMKSLSEELDEVYAIIGDKDFWEFLKKE